MDFSVQKICDDVYSINDSGNSSFYVIIGTEKAAVIDTGITKDARITPVIRSLTDKPLLLIITHAHLDHLHHMDEFSEVYMSHRELKLSPAVLEAMACGKTLDYTATIDIKTDSLIEIGGNAIKICELPGHSPGGIMALDQKHDLLFTGDCLGSGCGVWMQVDTATSLDTFYDGLVQAFQWLVAHGGRMAFWGGHNMQVHMSLAVPKFNPLSLGLMADLIDLVDQVRSGKLVGTPTDQGVMRPEEQVLYVAYGRAEMLYIAEDIHNDRYLRF